MALHKELVAIELHPVGVLNRLGGLDANHHVLRVGIVLTEVVAVVGRNQRQSEVPLQLEQSGMDPVFHWEPLVLNFQKEVFLAEDIAVGRTGLPGGRIVPFHQPLRDFPLQATGKPDQPLGMFGEKLLADARLVIEAVQRGFGRNFGEVPVTLFVLGKDQ